MGDPMLEILLFCTVALSASFTNGFECNSCRNARNLASCNQVEVCKYNENACVAKIEYKKGYVYKINMGCTQSCSQPNYNECRGKRCQYCCTDTSRCNEGLYAPTSPPWTQSPYYTKTSGYPTTSGTPSPALPGPPGPSGPAGPQGPVGPPGQSGQPGRDGMKGEMGDKGERGVDGFPGKPGVPGIPGEQGPVGPPGRPGLPSPPGRPGAPGPKGDQGHPGVQGRNGNPGVPGPRGALGNKGDIGLPGLPGKDGLPGVPGPKGDQGETGQKGDDGSPGLQGPRGLQGYAGPPGPQGKTGSPGVAGPIGPPGQVGACQCNQTDNVVHKIAFSVRANGVKQEEEYLQDIPLEVVIVKINSVEDTWIFEKDVLNFTAPINGAYFFHLTSIANGNGATPLMLFHNEELAMMTSRSDEDSIGTYPIGSNSVVLVLAKGDVVSVRIQPKRLGFIGDIFNKFSSPSDVSFTGHLLFAKSETDVW